MFTLKHNGKEIKTFETLNEALEHLHKQTSASWEWNFKYEGWKIFKGKRDITETLIYVPGAKKDSKNYNKGQFTGSYKKKR